MPKHKSFSSIINTPDYVKCTSLNNQQCLARPTFIKLHPNERNEGLSGYPFAVNLERYIGNCNTLNDLSNIVKVPNKTEYLNLSVLNMITGKKRVKNINKTYIM